MEVLLIGNKTDLETERQVTKEEGQSFADKEGLRFFEISATEYKKVEGAFYSLAEGIVKKIEKGDISDMTTGVKMSDDLKIDPLGSQSSKR